MPRVPILHYTKPRIRPMASRDTVLELVKHRFVVTFPSGIEFDRWYHEDHATSLILSVVESVLGNDVALPTSCNDKFACDSMKSVAFSIIERAR